VALQTGLLVDVGFSRAAMACAGPDGSSFRSLISYVAVVDAQGRIVPIANNEIFFEVTGGRIIGVGNGHPNTRESDKLPKRMVFNGLAQVVVQSTKQPGSIHLKTTSLHRQAIFICTIFHNDSKSAKAHFIVAAHFSFIIAFTFHIRRLLILKHDRR
jgi:hypothetical protein